MNEPTQMPSEGACEIGACYNYGGQNYVVTQLEPNRFLVLGATNQWTDAVGFTDVVGEGETAALTYVMALDQFLEFYAPGQVDEANPPTVDNSLPDGAPPVPGQLPAETPEPKES